MTQEIASLGFSNGVNVGTPTKLAKISSQLQNFASHAAFVAAHGGPTQGDSYWNTTDLLAYIYNGTAWVEIGSGSGAGEKNYITNQNGETNTDGYAAYSDTPGATPVNGAGAGTIDITFTTQATTVLSGDKSFKLSKPASNCQGQGVSFDYTIDKSDMLNVLKNEFVYNTDGTYVAGDFAIYIYDVDTSTLITPRVTEVTGYDKDNSGSIKFITDFSPVDVTSTNYRWIVHITTTATGAFDLYFDENLVGPGVSSRSDVAGPNNLYTPGTNGLGTISSDNIIYTQVGSNLYLSGELTTGTNTAVEGRIDLPTGLTIGGTFTGPVARGTIYRGASSTARAIVLITPGDAFINMSLWNDASSSEDALTPGTGSGVLGASSKRISIEAGPIPIAEWAGTGTTNLGANDVEYAFNTSTATTGDDTTSFGYGPQGVAFNIITSDGHRDVKFQTRIQSTDIITLEVSHQGEDKWHEVEGVEVVSGLSQFSVQGTQRYGFGVTLTNALDEYTTRIEFAQYAYPNSATYAAAGASWSSVASNLRWRLKKARSGIPVGFGLATSEHAGLVKKNKWSTIQLSQDVTASDTDLSTTTGNSTFIFNNLVVGNLYRIALTPQFVLVGTSALERLYINIIHDSTTKARAQHRNDGQTDASIENSTTTAIFTATATVVTFELSISGTGTLEGNSDFVETWASIEELNNYEDETTDFD